MAKSVKFKYTAGDVVAILSGVRFFRDGDYHYEQDQAWRVDYPVKVIGAWASMDPDGEVEINYTLCHPGKGEETIDEVEAVDLFDTPEQAAAEGKKRWGTFEFAQEEEEYED